MERLKSSVLVFGLIASVALVTSCADGLYEDNMDYDTSLASDEAIEGAEAVYLTISQVDKNQIDSQRLREEEGNSIFSLLVEDDHPVEISLENYVEKVKTIQMAICDEEDFLTLKKCEITDRTTGFLCRASEGPNGCCNVNVFSLSASDVIEEGSGPIVVLKYYASADAPAGACRSLTTENVTATGVMNNPLEVIASQGEFCFAADVFPCDDVIIDPESAEVFPGTIIDFFASSDSGNEHCVPECYEWTIASDIGSTISSGGLYQAGSSAGVDEITLIDECAENEPLARAVVTVVVEDSDQDGVPDDEDMCPGSNRATRVLIKGCDSGVFNAVVADGCSMNDWIEECVNEENNHGEFVSCVAYLTNSWKKDGLITGKEKGAMQSCAAQ